jgi:hypothetical protein
MSRLSDNQRRTICRLAFIAFAAFPASWVVYWIIHRPGAAEWQAMIQAKLGINVEIESVETPLPNTTVLRGLKFHEATGQKAIQLDEVRIVRGGVQKIFVEQTIALTPESLINLIRSASDQLSRVGCKENAWQFNLAKLSLIDERQDGALGMVLRPVQISFQERDSAVYATLRTTVLGQDRQNVQQWEYGRSLVGAEQWVTIVTGNGNIPCYFAGGVFKNVAALGADSHFSGIIQLRVDSEHKFSGRLQGDIRGVSLRPLMGCFGQQMDGWCEVRDIDCRILESRIQSIRGNLRSIAGAGGRVTREILAAAQEYLGLRPKVPIDHELVHFRALDLYWEIADGYLSIWNPSGVVAVDAYNQILLSSERENTKLIELRQLANFLVQPASDAQLDDETILVMNRFVHPKSVRTADYQNQDSPDLTGQY